MGRSEKRISKRIGVAEKVRCSRLEETRLSFRNPIGVKAWHDQ